MNSICYMGTFDDVVSRYPWSFSQNAGSYQTQLITAAIYDQDIALNDGYLVANPELSTSLKEISRSCLGSLMVAGTVRLFCRGEPLNLAEGIEKRAPKIPFFRDLTSAPEWSRTRDNLEGLSQIVSTKSIRWPQNKNMGQLFYNTLKIISSRENRHSLFTAELIKDFENTFQLFDRHLNNSTFDGARSVWECAAWATTLKQSFDETHLANLTNHEDATTTEQKTKICKLMHIANEAYHLAYSLALWESGERKLSVNVQTALCPSSNSLFEPTPQTSFNEEGGPGLNQLLISVRPMNFKDDADFSMLQQLQLTENVRLLRSHYLSSLDEFMKGKLAFEVAAQAREEYVIKLSELFAPQTKEDNIDRMVRILSNTISSAVDFFAVGGISCILDIATDDFRTHLYEAKYRVSATRNTLLSEGIEYAQSSTQGQLARDLGLIRAPVGGRDAADLIDSVNAYPTS